MVEFAIELLHLGFSVGGGGQSDAPIRMQVVHMREGKKAMQRCVDRCGYRVVAKGTERIHLHHRVFSVLPAIKMFECQQFVLVKRGEPRALDAAEISAAALYPEHLHGLAGKRIELVDFGTGVAAREVSDAQVRAEQIGAISQQLGFIQLVGYGWVPTIFKKLEGGRSNGCNGHFNTTLFAFDRTYLIITKK